MSRTRKDYEARDVAAGAARMVRGLVRRAGDGDTEALVELVKLQAIVAEAANSAGGALIDFGHDYPTLAGELNISRQGARQRFAPYTTEGRKAWAS